MSTIQCSKFNLSERFFLFALEIVKLVRSLPNDPAAREIGKQLIRAGTSIAANYEEALGSFSRKDFTYKLSTAFKEARETNLWLRLLKKSEIVRAERLLPILQESEEIRNILGKGVSTARKTL